MAVEKLDRGDVYVNPIPIRECDNDECEEVALYAVSLDLRETSHGIAIGEYCETHAQWIAQRLRDSLPAETNQWQNQNHLAS